MENVKNESDNLQIELENLKWENLKRENERLKNELDFLKQKHEEEIDALKQKHTEEMCEKIHLDNLRRVSLKEELENLRQQHDEEMCEKMDLVIELENAVKAFQDTERKLSAEIELCSELQKVDTGDGCAIYWKFTFGEKILLKEHEIYFWRKNTPERE